MITRDELQSGCNRFLQWLDRNGYAGHDPYDLWGTRFGIWSRRQYYRRGWMAAPLVAPLVAVDLVCPSIRRLLVAKERYATSDAQLVLAFINLHAVTGDNAHLDRALDLGEEIMAYAIPGYHGPCWGYPFDWQNGKGAVWPKHTPYITCTPYVYEAFLELHRATGDHKYLERASGIAGFVFSDLRELPVGPESAAGSYSPYDARQVVNATAYRAFVLADAGVRLDRQDYRDAALRNLNFVLESQSADGSWLYAMNEGKSYIDNFHTCFVLKNLFKIQATAPDPRIGPAIERGFGFYQTHLIGEDGIPRPFAVEPRLRLVSIEMYDIAEGITLCTLLRETVPAAGELASGLATQLLGRFQLADGHFVTRVYRGGIRNAYPFIRWPQAQLFLALTNLWRALGNGLPTPT